MEKQVKACAFTGYRNAKLYDSMRQSGITFEQLHLIVRKLIQKKVSEGFTVFLCGMAIGSDMIFAKEVIAVKQANPIIELHAIIPCLNQEANWSHQDKESYYQLLENADRIVYTSDNYEPSCMHKRNRYLVDNSDELMAIYDGKKGGSQYTVNYAIKHNKKITTIDPSNFLKVTLL